MRLVCAIFMAAAVLVSLGSVASEFENVYPLELRDLLEFWKDATRELKDNLAIKRAQANLDDNLVAYRICLRNLKVSENVDFFSVEDLAPYAQFKVPVLAERTNNYTITDMRATNHRSCFLPGQDTIQVEHDTWWANRDNRYCVSVPMSDVSRDRIIRFEFIIEDWSGTSGRSWISRIPSKGSLPTVALSLHPDSFFNR